MLLLAGVGRDQPLIERWIARPHRGPLAPEVGPQETAYARWVQEFDALAPRPLTEPAPSRLPASTPRRAEILARHAASLRTCDVGYLDPESGLFVLNARFLAERQRCCHTGCRHCPYTTE